MNIKELLGTEDKKEQLERIQELIAKAANPPVDLLIRYEPIADQVSVNVIGGDVVFEILYRMLELTRQALHRSEMEALMQQQLPPIEEEAE